MKNCLFPQIDPFREGNLQVSDLHTIHFEEVGTPGGQPSLFLHGGPGVGISPGYRRFFDPEHYHCILPDQRGAGRSTPHAELAENTTWHLVEDLERLRAHLGIERWTILGGSWGSLLALCYAIRHPNRVDGLVLRGVFLGRPCDEAWVFGGVGTARLFPDAWQRFREPIKSAPIEDIVAAYYAILTCDNEESAKKAAIAWAEYGATTMTLLPDPEAIMEISNERNALALARLECAYSLAGFYLPCPNYILDNAEALRKIPCRLIHGRYDAICDVGQAFELHSALPNSMLEIVPNGGHSPMEDGMCSALITATEAMKRTPHRRV